VALCVADDGDPPRSNVTSFLIVAHPLPQLSLTMVSTNALLSWPEYAAGFFLQAATNLNGSPCWVAVTNPVSANSNRYFVTEPLAAAERFYRLARP
jgi:hypothetical protein